MKKFNSPKYQKTNDHQIRQIVKGLTKVDVMDKHNLETIHDVLVYLESIDKLDLPFDVRDEMFVQYERMPLLKEIMFPKKSDFIRVLEDRPTDVMLAVDSVMSGKDALYLTTLAHISDAKTWLEHMSDPVAEIIVIPYAGRSVILAPVAAFVPTI